MKKDVSFFKKIRQYVPTGTIVCFAIAVVSLLAWIIMKFSTSVADAVNATTGLAIRFVVTTFFNIFPFSFVEMLVLISPLLLAALIIYIVKTCKKGKKAAIRLLCGVLSVVFVLFSAFSLGYEASYYRTSIEKNVGIERYKLSAENLRDAALLLQQKMEPLLDEVKYLEDGSSVLPYTFSKMSEKLNEDIGTFCEKYPAYTSIYSVAKPLLTSEPFTYTHLSGVYSFFTGEANINTNYPDFIVVTTSAHEMMHLRGIGKEDEADFAAFLVCIGSGDDYIKYCGYLEIYRQVMSDLYSADRTMWAEARETEDARIRKEITSFSNFFDKYRENKVAEITETVNNAYITSQNQPAGSKSYGLVVDLAVSYLLSGQN